MVASEMKCIAQRRRVPGSIPATKLKPLFVSHKACLNVWTTPSAQRIVWSEQQNEGHTLSPGICGVQR